jgi:putative acyl-CoA dehydrogenase
VTISTVTVNATHEIFNQPPPFADVDLFAGDAALGGAAAAFGLDGGGNSATLSAFGRRWGSAEMLEHGRLANEHAPRLNRFDASGRRRDEVEFHPSYHRLMSESIAAGLAAMTWQADGNGSRAPAPAEVARAARYYMVAQVENGHMCPVTMTRAAVAALAAAPELAGKVLPCILSRRYDRSFRPWEEKSGITLGMGMTEKQGGSDVRANTTRAVPAGEAGGGRGDGGTFGAAYLITGHKWFLSAPMSDAFLVLAQADAGLTCFLLPRFRPDGTVNALRLQRLKDKLGNRSNASAEVEFEDAFAWRVGEAGRGVRTIIGMVQLTRLDCAIASAGLMRGALVRALHHARHRRVFRRRLADQPLMRAVLAALALEVEGAVAAVMRLARSFDLATGDAREAARARLLTPAIKYWVCKTAPALIYEAMECIGGNAYVEESILPRCYREAPVNAIWEGSGNVVCLDVIRALTREREAVAAVLADLAGEARDLPGAAAAIAEIEAMAGDAAGAALAGGADGVALAGDADGTALESGARAITERLAVVAAAAACKACAPPVAELFARMRLLPSATATYGTQPMSDAEAALLLERALPG